MNHWSNPTVALVTAAPELPGGAELRRALTARDITVFAGHSGATAAQLIAATADEKAPLSGVTHLFNAMRPLHHRDPGIPGTVLGSSRLFASMIVDGIHVHPDVVLMCWRLLGERLILVSDAVAALGMPPGVLRLGDVDLVVTESDVRLRDGTLAGSMLSLDAAVRNLVRFTGATLSEAVFAASTAPANALGRTDIGRLTAGAVADLVRLSHDGHVHDSWVSGMHAYSVQGDRSSA
jgi:N-acetylglucosamine-6-phosphate deacetylase